MAKKQPSILRAVGANAGPSKVDQFIEDASQEEALRFVEEFGCIREKCESPIEELLLAAMFSASKVVDFRLDFMPYGDALPAEAYTDEAAFVFQQIQFGPYRADIAILDATLPFDLARPRVMIVECDGHDFHERTKDQARRDKQRDRWFQSRGYKVLRFTGSEIWADPDKCADEVIEQLARDDDWRNRVR